MYIIWIHKLLDLPEHTMVYNIFTNSRAAVTHPGMIRTSKSFTIQLLTVHNLQANSLQILGWILQDVRLYYMAMASNLRIVIYTVNFFNRMPGLSIRGTHLRRLYTSIGLLNSHACVLPYAIEPSLMKLATATSY